MVGDENIRLEQLVDVQATTMIWGDSEGFFYWRTYMNFEEPLVFNQEESYNFLEVLTFADTQRNYSETHTYGNHTTSRKPIFGKKHNLREAFKHHLEAVSKLYLMYYGQTSKEK